MTYPCNRNRSYPCNQSSFGGGNPAGRARSGLGLGVWRGGLEGRGGLHGGLPGRLGLLVLTQVS